MKEHQDMFNEFFEETTNKELLEAKAEGLEAVKKYIKLWERTKGYQVEYEKGFNWRLMEISNETANQLLNGKFTTFEEFDLFNQKTVITGNIQVLYKEIINNNKGDYDYIIETIFINE